MKWPVWLHAGIYKIQQAKYEKTLVNVELSRKITRDLAKYIDIRFWLTYYLNLCLISIVYKVFTRLKRMLTISGV